MADDSIKRAAAKVCDLIFSKREKDPEAYDTTATVRRVEGGTAFVHIPGGVDETPVALTIDAAAGDTVQVRVSGGTAWLVGNKTAPPTDDTEALVGKALAKVARQVADNAEDTAVAADTKATEAAEAAAEVHDLAEQAKQDADDAKDAAQEAKDAADEAKTTTDEINAYAQTAGKTVTQILNDGETAGTAAAEAKASAENASEYASRALGSLSTLQSITETLTWIAQHGTMALTSDQQLDPTHVYFIRDNAGDYTVGGVKYAIVPEPDAADLSTYYELTIDESLNNYVGTHLALDGEGLWLLPAATGTNKVLIATGAGSTYTTAGTYLIGPTGGITGKFTADAVQIGQNASGKTRTELTTAGMQIIKNDDSQTPAQDVQIANLGFGQCLNSQGQLAYSPYYTFGKRYQNSNVGTYSVVEGVGGTASASMSHAEGEYTTASDYDAHAEGSNTVASGAGAHAEGFATTASDEYAHAEGASSTASGLWSHAQNRRTIAAKAAQTALGTYNTEDTSTSTTHPSGDTRYGAHAFIIGNGTADNARSNALTVGWNGNLNAAGDISADAGLTAGTDIVSGAGITAGGDIWSDGKIEADGDMNCNGNMSTGGLLTADGDIESLNGGVIATTGDIGTLTATTLTTTSNITAGGNVEDGYGYTIASVRTTAAQAVADLATLGTIIDSGEKTITTLATGTSWVSTQATVSLSAGKWIMIGWANFATKANTTYAGTRRAIRLYKTTATAGAVTDSNVIVNASDANTNIQTVYPVSLTGSSNTSYRVEVLQNSGSQLSNCHVRLWAVKVGIE